MITAEGHDPYIVLALNILKETIEECQVERKFDALEDYFQTNIFGHLPGCLNMDEEALRQTALVKAQEKYTLTFHTNTSKKRGSAKQDIVNQFVKDNPDSLHWARDRIAKETGISRDIVYKVLGPAKKRKADR